MLKELSEKYYSQFELNCAEAIIYAANECYDLNLEKETLKTMGGFGGGMAIESVCGAITGGIAVLGILFIKEKAHEGERMKQLTVELIHTVEEKMGTHNCKELKEKYRNEEVKCKNVVMGVAEILEAIIKREMN